MKKLLALFLLFTFYFLLSSSAQNVGIGTNTPNAFAILEVSSTNKGFLPPRMTYVQRNAIVNPAAGLIVYCTDCGLPGGEPQYFNGTSWFRFNGNPTTVIDVDGNIYPTVTIGNQTWMAENLRTKKYSDGTIIRLVTDDREWRMSIATSSPLMCWYNNDEATYTGIKFGALYNGYAINPGTNGNKNVCPSGWHVPSEADWATLITFLGDELVRAFGGSYAGGGKMKTTGTQYWQSPNTDATNSSGFSGLPAGFRGDFGSFSGVGTKGVWWSSESSYCGLRYDIGAVELSLKEANSGGRSIRCVRD
jgi:uncharacterized protein (TIGR02145 family)